MMHKWKLIISQLLWFLIFESVYGQFDVKPLNAYVMNGDSVTLDCTIQNVDSASTLQLWRDGDEIVLSTDGTSFFEEEYEIEGKFNLKILKANESYGEKYSCENTLQAGDPVRYYASLIVLDSHTRMSEQPNETTVIEGVTVKYECQIEYSGPFAPVITWTNSSGNPITPTDNSQPDIVRNFIEFPVEKEHHDKRFLCNTAFEEPSVGENEANNAPDYTNTQTSAALTVHYFPQDTKLQKEGKDINDDDRLYPGEEITCVSDSRPAIYNFTWTLTNMTDNTTHVLDTTGSTVEVQASWLGMVMIECIVRNYMGPDSSVEGTDSVIVENLEVYITTTTTTTSTTTQSTTSQKGSVTTDNTNGGSSLTGGAIAGIVIGIVVTIGLIILLVICCCRKTQKEKDAEATKPPKSAFQADQVRHPSFNSNSLDKPPQSNVSTIDRQGPPPYNGDYSYDSQDAGYGDHRQRNPDGVVYADLALDDTPRSRKPIQVYEPTDYAEVKRV